MDEKNNYQGYLSGPEAEELACQYSLDQSLALLGRNFRTRRGEIDLIMKDNGHIVFVEVRFRRSDAFGSAAESITQAKCRRLGAAALVYLQHQGYNSNTPARFDAVVISPKKPLTPGKHTDYAIEWIQNIIM